MGDANGLLFQRLSDFCSSRGVSLDQTDGYRYLKGDEQNDSIIKHLKLVRRVEFGPQRVAVHAIYDECDLFIVIGFEHLDDFVNRYQELGDDVQETDFLPGHAVVILSEIDVRPVGSGREAQAYVEVADSNTLNYEGHDFDEIKRLFPRISVFQCRSALTEDRFYQLTTKFAAAESSYGGGWINEELLENLFALASISAVSFPYQEVSRAAFDADPRSLFLALYRCLEATYAHKGSKDLAKALGLNIAWADLAVILSQNLSWRPRESSSLEAVLEHATSADLCKVIASLGGKAGADPARSAAKLIYELRNRIVHFDASMDSVDLGKYDWNSVCSAFVGVVFDVFNRAFDPAVA